MDKKLILNNLRSLSKICPLQKIQIFNNNLIVFIKPDILLDILLFFKNHISYQFKLLTCISGVDYPWARNRFELSYERLSITFNRRLRLKICTNEINSVESVC